MWKMCLLFDGSRPEHSAQAQEQMTLKLSETDSNTVTAMSAAWRRRPQMLADWMLRQGHYSSTSGTLPTTLVAKESNEAACRCVATTDAAADLIAALDRIAILAKHCEELKDQLMVSRHENEGVSLALSRSND